MDITVSGAVTTPDQIAQARRALAEMSETGRCVHPGHTWGGDAELCQCGAKARISWGDTCGEFPERRQASDEIRESQDYNWSASYATNGRRASRGPASPEP